MNTAVQVSMYLSERDPWDEVLQLLHDEKVATASVFHAVAGFNGRNSVHRAHLVDAGGHLPVLLVFVDLEEHVGRVLPKVCALVPKRLIVRENVRIEQGSFE